MNAHLRKRWSERTLEKLWLSLATSWFPQRLSDQNMKSHDAKKRWKTRLTTAAVTPAQLECYNLLCGYFQKELYFSKDIYFKYSFQTSWRDVFYLHQESARTSDLCRKSIKCSELHSVYRNQTLRLKSQLLCFYIFFQEISSSNLTKYCPPSNVLW